MAKFETNRLTAGVAGVGDVLLTSANAGHVQKAQSNTLARTDTSAKNLFTLPPGAVIISLSVLGAAVSNAGTTATISVGKSGGAGTEYLSGFDVKGSTGLGQQTPTGATLTAAAVATAQIVTGIYAETGGASTLGGPWTVVIEYWTL